MSVSIVYEDTRNEPELALRVGEVPQVEAVLAEAMRIRAGLPTAGVYLESPKPPCRFEVYLEVQGNPIRSFRRDLLLESLGKATC